MKKQLVLYIVLCLSAGTISAQDAVTGPGMQVDRSAGSTTAKNVPDSGQRDFIYPNPVTDHLWVNLSNDTREDYRITLFDMNGRIWYRRDFPVEPGVHKFYLNLPYSDRTVPLFVKVTEAAKDQEKIFRIIRQ